MKCRRCGIDKDETSEFFKLSREGILSKTCRGCDRRGRPAKPAPEPSATGRVCTCCRRVFPEDLEHFGALSSEPDGMGRTCRGCLRAARKKSHHKNPERSKAWTQTPAGRLQSIRNGAHQRGIAFELTLADVEPMIGAPCRYCGQTIDGLSVDRVDSTKGYTLNNIVVCCKMCNVMKGGYPAGVWVEHIARVLVRMGPIYGW